MPITCLGLLTSTYFINLWTPQTHHPPTSSLSQQVNAVISLRSAATWRKLKQLFFENHSTDSQMGSAIDLHSEVVGSNPAGKWFFLKIILFECTFFWNSDLMALFLGIPSTHQNGTWAKLNARHLWTKMCWLLMDISFCLYSELKALGDHTFV